MSNTKNIFLPRLIGKNSVIERVVVIGKNGFVGSSVISLLNQEGIITFDIGRDEIDLTSPLAQEYFLRVINPGDVVIFAAGDVPVKNIRQLKANLCGLENFIRGIEGIELSQLIYVSSDAVYLDTKIPLNEGSIRAPESLHGLMHLTREVILQNSSLKGILCIVRPTLIYGARDSHNGYGPCSFMRLAERSEPIVLYGDGEEERDFIHISNVSEIICKIVQNRFIGALNLATGEVHSFFEIATLVSKILKSQIQIIKTARTGPIPHNGYRPFQIDKLKLFFPENKMISLEVGLRFMASGE